jgi:hypothetical protein
VTTVVLDHKQTNEKAGGRNCKHETDPIAEIKR